MSVHKLTAGDGYTYLTRQVAVHDATDRGHQGLADYYAEKGETPGRWFGSGLAGVDLAAGSEVTEAHMRNLFGEGRHPDAERLEEAALDAGRTVKQALETTKLGRPFAIYRGHAPEFLQETARRYVAYNKSRGEHWRTTVPPEVRAKIRTEIGNEMFLREHGRAPLDDRERGSFMAQVTRQQTTAVSGYDLTFTPVKSVSTLWALADRDVAKEIEHAHHAAVEATLGWLEREALYTRRGSGGIQQVKTTGLLAAMFTHRDARSSDPHLHTHVAVSNKVQDASGRWLALDGRVLYKANVTCSEMYNTLLESELVARLGLRFENRRQGVNKGADKRPVREVVGVDQRLATAWSSRRNEIEARRRELAAAFQAQHGRPPTVGEAVTLAAKAWEQTREAKHEPRAEADQRATWMAEATAILGDQQAVDDMVETCLGHKPSAPDITDEWVTATAQHVVERVAEDRATWQVWHLRAEAQRQARAHGIRLSELDTAVDAVVTTAITEYSIAFDDPDPLTREATATPQGVTIPAPLQRTENSGTGPEVVSVYSLAGTRQYTSPAVVEAEKRIVEAATRTGGRTISEVRVGIAIAEAAANELQLNAAQSSLVREMATSGRDVQLALAPAGTGKTTAMQVLTRAWQDSGGTVIGLAPSAVAAQELGASINPEPSVDDPAEADGRRLSRLRGPRRPGRRKVRSDTLAKLVWHANNGGAPAWMERINAKTLVLIDEAGMAATTDLAAAIDYITARGGQVRLVGDDKQLASVAAGGVLRDIAHQVGAVTLSEVHRFRNRDGSLNHAEAAATLALREGDPSSIAFYADRGRIHVGDLGACADQAYAAWAADRAEGIDAVLIAPTRDLVAELNTRARNDRIAGLNSDQLGRVLTLADGTKVSAGDRIITRENERRLAITNTDWVKNRDRWTVRTVNADGSLTVTHDALNKTITLPSEYVANTVELGYATTVHGAQGITTGTCHVVLTGEEDRNLLYVALSRGRFANHLYLNVASDGDPHNLIRPEALLPPTALDKITEMLRRDGSPTSATTALREQTNPHQLLGDLAARYHDAVTSGCENLLGPTGMSKIDDRAETLVEGITEAAAWPTLRAHLALHALDEHNPLALLTTAVAVGSLDDARDPAAVLDARIDDIVSKTAATHTRHRDTAAPTTGPLPWLPDLPSRLAEEYDWGPFTATYHQLVTDQIETVRDLARSWTGATAPAWAQPFLEDADTELRADLAVWRAVSGVADEDLRPTGERKIGAPGAHQARLNRAVNEARPSYPFAQRAWYQALPEAVRRDPWITPLCQRLARLERAGLPVADYITAALASDPANPDTSHGPGDGTIKGSTAARPLPDEHQAAALWWRLVPHLGPAALGADEHSANLLQPTWRTTLAELVGTSKADYLQTTQAWPALVAAVDEACQHHGWAPRDILEAALAGIPQDGRTTGGEVADALVLRIAMLTDHDEPPLDDTTAPYPDPALDPDQAPPEDAEDFMADYYRDQPDETGIALGHSPTGGAADAEHLADDRDYDPAAYDHEGPPPGPDEWEPPRDDPDFAPFDDLPATIGRPIEDPYLPPLPGQGEDEVSSEFAFPDPDEVPAERIFELNQQALAYYESCYSRSWAPAYLRERIRTDLTDHPAFTAGYAPSGPRSLLTHLTKLGATITEMEQAGLIRERERRDGTTEWVDMFRDRLIMPIRDHNDPTGQAVTGFLGRRNPTKTDDDFAGPKYLNTKTTTVFTKGEALFGAAEASDLLANGALLVIVEGAMDALAITLGSGGRAVGLAPMGTALTVNQIKLLRSHLDLVNGRDRIAVATDPDVAGWKSAQTAYWNLTAGDLEPAHLELRDGLDPAKLYEDHGAEAILNAIENRAPLGDVLVDHIVDTAGDRSDPDVRQKVITQVARVLAARGAETWPAAFDRVRGRLNLAAGIVDHQTLNESVDRDRNRAAYAQARIDELQDQTRTRVPKRERVPHGGIGEQFASPAPTQTEATTPAAPPRQSGPAR